MLTGELWEGLSSEELEQAERFCPERHLPEGATVFAPGDPSDALYVLKSGIVSLSHVEADHWAAIALPLTHQRLADMIGTSRETVSRHLALLKRQGAVKQEGRRLVVQPTLLQVVVPEWPAPAESPVPSILPSTT